MKNSAQIIALSALCALLFSALPAQALPQGMAIKDYVSGLQFPVSLAVTDHDDIIVVEKFGNIRLVRDGQLIERPIASVEVTAQNEAGLIGVTLTPDYATSREFLIFYTPEEPLDKIFISRLKLEGERATMLDERWLELPSRPGTDRHYGGNMAFSPDGQYLFITLGDLRDATHSQNPNSLPGSVLRYHADRSIPADNPFGPENPVFAYGLRNPVDLAFDSRGNLYTGANSDDVSDEINLIEAGKNYGWPLIQGYCDNFPTHEPCADADLFTDPAFEFRTIIGPTGIMVYGGELFPELKNHILMGGWHSAAIHRLVRAEPDSRLPEGALNQVGALHHASGEMGITDLAQANDGSIFVLLAGPSGGEIKRIVRAQPGDEDRDEDKDVGDEEDPDDAGESPDDSPADEPAAGGGGCSCSAADAPAIPGSLAWLAALGALALWRRRD